MQSFIFINLCFIEKGVFCMRESNLLSNEELEVIENSKLTIEEDENTRESGAAAAAGGVFLAAAAWPNKSY